MRQGFKIAFGPPPLVLQEKCKCQEVSKHLGIHVWMNKALVWDPGFPSSCPRAATGLQYFFFINSLCLDFLFVNRDDRSPLFVFLVVRSPVGQRDCGVSGATGASMVLVLSD